MAAAAAERNSAPRRGLFIGQSLRPRPPSAQGTPGFVVGLPRSMPGAVVLSPAAILHSAALPVPVRSEPNRTEPNPPAPISRATSPCKEMPRVSFIWKTESVTEFFSGAFAFQNLKTSGFSVPCIKRYNNVRKNRKLNTPPASLSGLEIRGVRRRSSAWTQYCLKTPKGSPGGGSGGGGGGTESSALCHSSQRGLLSGAAQGAACRATHAGPSALSPTRGRLGTTSEGKPSASQHVKPNVCRWVCFPL